MYIKPLFFEIPYIQATADTPLIEVTKVKSPSAKTRLLARCKLYPIPQKRAGKLMSSTDRSHGGDAQEGQPQAHASTSSTSLTYTRRRSWIEEQHRTNSHNSAEGHERSE
jgi:hypothetical protein